MFDIIFLSYDEQNKDNSWAALRKRFPWALQVDGIKGIYQAHLAAATLARTKMFWVIDADAEILPEFDFSFYPYINQHLVHVWYAKNPVNGLEYGFGGVKLFPRSLLLSSTSAGIDVTTSLLKDIIVIDKVASITNFNTDPLTTWRSAFRENVKLTLNLTNGYEDENKKRMNAWLTTLPTHPKYASYAVAGAQDGQRYALTYKNQEDKLVLINDYNWLKKGFEEYYVG
jgi:hypothetical protein